MSHGYASVSLSAQIQGLEGIQRWNPTRYGALSLTAPNIDPATGTATLAGGREVLSFDVFTQTVEGLRQTGHLNPIRGKVKQVIALGESQSASRLTDYYNSIDPLYRAIDGVVFYDAAGRMAP
jgi:hypothetical protein